MIKEISRGEGFFTIQEYDYTNLYFKGQQGDSIYGYCHVQLTDGLAYVHFRVERFGGGVLKEMKRDFESLKELLRARGVWRILGTHEMTGCAKWLKFIRLIGFQGATDKVTPSGVPVKLTTMEI